MYKLFLNSSLVYVFCVILNRNRMVLSNIKMIDLSENGKDEGEARQMPGKAIRDYAEEYDSKYKLYHNSTDRKRNYSEQPEALAAEGV